MTLVSWSGYDTDGHNTTRPTRRVLRTSWWKTLFLLVLSITFSFSLHLSTWFSYGMNLIYFFLFTFVWRLVRGVMRRSISKGQITVGSLLYLLAAACSEVSRATPRAYFSLDFVSSTTMAVTQRDPSGLSRSHVVLKSPQTHPGNEYLPLVSGLPWVLLWRIFMFASLGLHAFWQVSVEILARSRRHLVSKYPVSQGRISGQSQISKKLQDEIVTLLYL